MWTSAAHRVDLTCEIAAQRKKPFMASQCHQSWDFFNTPPRPDVIAGLQPYSVQQRQRETKGWP